MKTGTVGVIVGVIIGMALGTSAAAAPPHNVSYNGTPVTTAVPGKPVTISFRVKNTGTTMYSGVQVIFHIPNGMAHSKVAPADAQIHDDIVSWADVPIAGGTSFYPSLTVSIDSGTPLETKKSIWVEVTGEDMEATSTNFSITAKAASDTTVTSTLSSDDIKSMFQSVYGRASSASELQYWLKRRTDKPGRTALEGAMGYHKANNIQH